MIKKALFLLAVSVPFLSSLNGEEVSYPVHPLVLKYAIENPQLPSLDEVSAVSVPRLGPIGDVGRFQAAHLNQASLIEIASAVVNYFNSQGIYGVRVLFSPYEIAADGDDLRPNWDQSLSMIIVHSEVGQMRLMDPDGEQLEAKRHEHIKKNAPVNEGEGDLLAPEELQQYLYWLNRYPNRQVDIQIGTVDGLGLVGIDFIISEEKPWRLYLNVANTGPSDLNKIQESVGFVHTQVTGNDDIFQVDFATDSFSQFHSVTAYYERPFLSYRRLRWRLQGDEARFSSAQLGLDDKEFVGSRYGARFQLDWNAYQKDDFFIDLIGALQYRYLKVRNNLRQETGKEDFLLPGAGIQMSRIRRTSLFFFELEFFLPINGATGVDERDLDRLGRLDVSKNWQILQGSTYGSVYLEALGDTGYNHLANEVFLFFGGQTSFGARLIPEYQNVLGGLYSVRGYPTAVIAGDSTLTGVFEYRLHVPQLFTPAKASPDAKLFGKPFRVRPEYPGGSTDWDLIFRGFLDYGRAYNHQSPKKTIPDDLNATLWGSGFGLELIIRQNLFLRAENAWALERVDRVKKGNYELYISGTLVY